MIWLAMAIGTANHNAACAHHHVVGADDDALVVLGDAATGCDRWIRVAELDGDRPVDGTHAADRSGILAASLTPSTKLRPAADAIW